MSDYSHKCTQYAFPTEPETGDVFGRGTPWVEHFTIGSLTKVIDSPWKYYFNISSGSTPGGIFSNESVTKSIYVIRNTSYVGVAGRITYEGNPLSGVSIGGVSTNANGQYASDDLEPPSPTGYTGTFTPVKAGYAFTPVSKGYSGLCFFRSGEDYVATLDLNPPEKPTGPTPSHKAARIAIDTDTIDWIDGGFGQPNAADSYDVYFGLDEDNLVLAASSQAATEFKINEIPNGSPFEYSQWRAWRIDAVNADGTTTGDTWVFSTGFWLSFPAQRLSNYEFSDLADKTWDIASQAWIDDADYMVAGGGRYKNQIIVIGHEKIYFGEI